MKLFKKILVGLFFSTMVLYADVHTDLQNLVSQGNILKAQVVNFSLFEENSCAELSTLNGSIRDFTVEVESFTSNLVVFSLTNADLEAIEELSSLVKDMAASTINTSLDMNTIADTAELFEYNAGLSAILQLSTDIGTMADRILEMADRILVMADNIGTMADRIITTQVIQSANMTATQNSILITQQNIVLLSDSSSTIVYNVTLGQIEDELNLLVNSMSLININSTNMDSELSSIELQTAMILAQTTALLQTVIANSSNMSNYINSDTLTMLGDLSNIYVTLSASLETYSQTIEQIAPLTDTVILSDATKTMLVLTKDIGLMADRIMQMTSKIFIMSDNIGVMADNIVETQNIQMTNVQLTESSLLSSQSIMITVIKNFGL